MSDRIRRPHDFGPYLAFCAKWLPEMPMGQTPEVIDDMILAVVDHTDPVPGSSPEARAEAVRLMQDFVDTLDPGTNVNRDMLMDAGKLPKDNKSDSMFTTRWAKENPQLNWNPAATSHFIKQLADGTPKH